MIDIIKMEGMPSWCVINGWLQDPEWQAQYARARMQMAHVVAETAIKEATENNTDDPQRALRAPQGGDDGGDGGQDEGDEQEQVRCVGVPGRDGGAHSRPALRMSSTKA